MVVYDLFRFFTNTLNCTNQLSVFIWFGIKFSNKSNCLCYDDMYFIIYDLSKHGYLFIIDCIID